jgi:hypothetical protein
MVPVGRAAMQLGILARTRALQLIATSRNAVGRYAGSIPQPNHDRVAVTIDTVIWLRDLDMLFRSEAVVRISLRFAWQGATPSC